MDEPRRKLILTCQNIIDVANQPHIKTLVLFRAAINGIRSVAKQEGVSLEDMLPEIAAR